MASASTPGPVRRSFGTVFDPRSNSLNLLRLVFASAVLLGHSVFLGGFGTDDIGTKTTLGTVSVYGFFAISGFLIAASAEQSPPGVFLRRRVLRIFPAFWGALVVTAAIIAPLAFLVRGAAPGCGLSCYLTAPDGPLGYLWRNAGLWIFQRDIAGTPVDVRVTGIWNGSLWTLAFEFGAYLILLVLAMSGMLRRPRLVVGLTLAAWAVEAAVTAVPSWNAAVTVFNAPVLMPTLVLLPIFLTGSCLWLLRDRIPDSGPLAAACAGAALMSLWAPIGADIPAYTLTSACLAAPLLVYPVMWLGCHLRFTRIGRRNDYSYGIYVYAFPVQQLLATLGLAAWGLASYTVTTAGITLALALFSWHVIERPALRRGRRHRPPIQPVRDLEAIT